ncbi:hypothetical protein ABPG74_021099 [Tetrahymena malaccensis]
MVIISAQILFFLFHLAVNLISCLDQLPIQVSGLVYLISETNAIIYKAAVDNIWRYSVFDESGSIVSTYLINGFNDLKFNSGCQPSQYFLQDNNQQLYFFTISESEYQLIDLSILTSNQQGYLQQSSFSNSQNCQNPFVRNYGQYYYYFIPKSNPYQIVKGSSLLDLQSSDDIITSKSYSICQNYIVIDQNYLVYKNNEYTDFPSGLNNLLLLDSTFDIFLLNNLLCKAKMEDVTFQCSKTYDLGIDNNNKAIISKIINSNGINLFFGYDYNNSQYIFFDALTLSTIQNSAQGDTLLAITNPQDFFQYQNNVYIRSSLYSITYNSLSSKIDVSLISSSLPSNYYQIPAENSVYNFQQGSMILLMKDSKNYLLNVNTLYCPANCSYCSKQDPNQCCIANCIECTDDQTCQVCATGNFLQFDKTCNNSCPSSAYVDSSNKQCKCDPNAVVVNGQCVCNNKYYQNGNKCFSCSSNCDVCQNSSSCQKCSAGYYLLPDGSCNLCDTQSGLYKYHLNVDRCGKCQSNCSVCQDSTSCQSCSTNFYLFPDGSCNSCDTQNGFYKYYQNTNRCGKCQSNCSVCKDSTNCQECSIGYSLFPDGQCKICNDKNGYYKYFHDIYKCDQCQPRCKICSNSSNCSLCQESFHILPDGQCNICDTSKAFYINKEKCVPCHSSCQTCIGSSKHECSSCYEGFILFNSLCQQVYLVQNNQTLISQSLIGDIIQSSKTISTASTYSSYAQSVVSSFLNQQSFSIIIQGIVISKLGFLGLIDSNLPIFVFMPLKNIKDQFPSKQLSFLNVFKQQFNESLIQYYDTRFYSTDLPFNMIYNCGSGIILLFGCLVVFTLFYFLIEKVENVDFQNLAVKLYNNLICSFRKDLEWYNF